jgi:hypothetical protein
MEAVLEPERRMVVLVSVRLETVEKACPEELHHVHLNVMR